MANSELTQPLVLQPRFRGMLGTFHGAWSSFEMVTDYAIGLFLEVPHQDTHLITAGMMWGRKARLLADLISRSNHPKKSELKGALNRIRGQGKREKITHSYLVSDHTCVRFIYRDTGQKYKADDIQFSFEEFSSHVREFVRASAEFQSALNVSKDDLNNFISAALQLNQNGGDT